MRFAPLAILAFGCGEDPLAGEDASHREYDVIVNVPRGIGSVVFREGDGVWQLAPRLDDRRYGFDLADNRYSVLVACADENRQEIEGVSTTLREEPDLVFTLRCEQPAGERLSKITGTLSGLRGSGYRAHSKFFSATDTFNPEPTEAYTLEAASGPQSLVFARLDGSQIPEQFVIRRDVAIAGDRTVDIDFDFEGVPARRGSIFTSSNFSLVQTQAVYFTADGTPFDLGVVFGNPAPMNYPPVDAMRAGDRITVIVTASDGTNEFMTMTQTSHNATFAPTTFSLPFQILSANVFTTEFGLRGAWTEYSTADRFVARLEPNDLVANQRCTLEICFPSWSFRASPEYLATAPSRSALLAPTVAEMQALGIWDDRLAFGGIIRWTATAVAPLPNGQVTSGSNGSISEEAP